MPSARARNSKRETEKVRELVPTLLRWFGANARDLPWRRTNDPYAIWVSEIMLQQTQVKTVTPYWERWLRELPTNQAVAKAAPAKLHKLWEGLGYYTRVRNLQKAARQIVAQRDGKFPTNFDDILSLPGIGRYTAGAIASIAFNLPRPILDGNVIRVLTRIFGIASNPREKQTNARLWELAAELVDHAASFTRHAAPCSHLNQSLMELGALICIPRTPQCDVCPVARLCVAGAKGWQDRLPNLGKRQAATERFFIAFVVEHDGKFLVRQRPAGVVNAHLWEFPNVEIEAQVSDSQHLAAKEMKVQLTDSKPLCTIKHSITRFRITLEAWRAQFGATRTTNSNPDGHWLTPRQLRRRALTSAHKKILGRLEVGAEDSPSLADSGRSAP